VAQRVISIQNMMIALLWNPAGLLVNDFLAGELFNGGYFVRNVLTPVHLLPIVTVADTQKQIYSACG
jgi:hypothetical protein